MEGADLATWLEFKENETLRRPTPTVSPFMPNMERYTKLYAYSDIIQNQLVGDVRVPLLWVVPVKSRYGETICVTFEQHQFLPLSRSNIHTVEINIRSDTGKLVLFESGKLNVALVFRRKSLFHWCIEYQHLKEQHIKEVILWWYLQRTDKNVCASCEEGLFEFMKTGPREWSSSNG